MPDHESDLCQRAYWHTFSLADHALALAERRDQVLDLVDRALSWTEHLLEETIQRGQAKAACGMGCSLCCRHLRIDARAHEIFLILRHLKRTRTEEELESLRSAALAATALRAPLPYDRVDQVAIPCILLRGDLCGLYAVRPGTCRRYFSQRFSACQAFADAPSPETAGAVEFPLIAELGRLAANGLHNAFIKAGYDGFLYDLHAALAEGLDSDLCEARWWNKRQAFSDAALAKTPPDFSQHQALADLAVKLQNAKLPREEE